MKNHICISKYAGFSILFALNGTFGYSCMSFFQIIKMEKQTIVKRITAGRCYLVGFTITN